jgi:hypothetical protein
MNNTTITNEDGKTKVTLYTTKIVEIDHATGEVTLNSGGHRTKTTKVRINQTVFDLSEIKNLTVVQKKGQWYVVNETGTYKFYDGITFSPDGTKKEKSEAAKTDYTPLEDKLKGLTTKLLLIVKTADKQARRVVIGVLDTNIIVYYHVTANGPEFFQSFESLNELSEWTNDYKDLWED